MNVDFGIGTAELGQPDLELSAVGDVVNIARVSSAIVGVLNVAVNGLAKECTLGACRNVKVENPNSAAAQANSLDLPMPRPAPTWTSLFSKLPLYVGLEV